MTALLERVIEELRHLPDVDQDTAAHLLMAFMAHDEDYVLTDEQQRKVERTLAGLDDGSVRILSDAEAAAMWKRFGP